MGQLLTVEHVKASARDYYAKGKLTAQHPQWHNRICQYVRGEYRCAIGSALNKTATERARCDWNSCNLSTLVEENVIEFENEFDQITIASIQEAHDDWARDGFLERETTPEKFLALIAA